MDATPNVLVTRAVPGVLDVPGASVRVLGEAMPDRRAVLDAMPGVDVLVSMFTDRVDDELLDAAGGTLRGVCQYAVGTDNIDLDACTRRGVVVCNTPDAVTEGTADLAWALLLAVTRRVVEADAYARSAAYPANGPLGMGDFLGADLTGRTLLIVGAGRIGRAVALRSIGWGMRVLYTARSRKWDMELAPLAARRVELDEGLAMADVVSLHTPLTPQTRHLIDARRLGLMKPGAILINTARGPVVDEVALADALRDGTIWGAGLDVFEREPVIHPGLLQARNVVLTPHIGSAERRYREMMTAMVADNARAILDGHEPPNRVA
ncbi:MAG: D-glycerate dehydrogenase [Phycisphaeraceae bacterium]|nr:D-glycerate dehydrogenase [Phycisphaeraceae bacterium]